ncbi:hypothetical protein BTVI_61386 [Pitangus sulphuratus]|nr:hypothetical protein BTVI_61386 [Pitangus sulphuratus]
MGGRLPLPRVAVAVALGVASGLYIYGPLFQPPLGPHPAEGTAGLPPGAAAAADKRPIVQGQELACLAAMVQNISGNIITLVFCWNLLPSKVVQQKGLDTEAYKAL